MFTNRGHKHRGVQNIFTDSQNSRPHGAQHELQTRTLKDVAVGETVKVTRLNAVGAIRRRIMDMGITKGVDLHLKRLAPLGDPMELVVRGYSLSLRKADGALIEVE